MSVRTVATHLKKVSDALGSTSRARLACLTAESGLLHGSPSPDRRCGTGQHDSRHD
ncbi:hypothetical protein [Streptomyces sp. NPDC086835]|jgi:hypothetical protein|uniref:hypothetical protein n=1 Tax=Streptomyces sp. NPDC086835 TaxID=3365761 RepID=UPI00380064B4